ncbi:MAG: hypothetical protein ACLGI8_14135 [Acidimicrobiia bacterium]
MTASDHPRRGAARRAGQDPGRGIVLACALAYLPFTFLGYGTDIDVADVLRSGGRLLDGEAYAVSRPPGAFVHELGTSILDRLGGSVLVNLASVAAATAALWAVHELTRRDGSRWPGWVALLVGANPWFWIAATSLGDYAWALGFALSGALQAHRGRRVLAGVLFGLAIGCRGSTGLLAAAWLIAERTGAPSFRPAWRASLTTAGTLLVVGAAAFVPPWLAADRTLGFLEHAIPFAGWRIHLGRWAVKNAAVIGVPAGIVFLVGVRRGFGALARWQASVVVRFAVFGFVVVELLYLRWPYKPLHLLPVVALVALLVGASPTVARPWMVALVAAQVVGGVVGSTIGEPDVPHAATSGRVVLDVVAGPLLNDVRCRLEDREDGPWPDPTDPDQLREAQTRAAELFDCQSRTWKAEPREPAGSAGR